MKKALHTVMKMPDALPVAPFVARRSIPVNLFFALVSMMPVLVVEPWKSIKLNPGAIFFMLASTAFALRCLFAVFDRREQVRFDLKGVLLRRSRYGLIPWSAITSGLSPVSIPNHPVISCAFDLNQPGFWMARAPLAKRVAWRLWPRDYFSISIPTFALNTSATDLCRAFSQMRALALKQRPAKTRRERRRRQFMRRV